tara:strand:+ start:1061 stop:1240 length:180 start_codon:yes stop_codon:yes gene_type:complete
MYEDFDSFELALQHFGTKVSFSIAMEMGGRINAEASYQIIKSELKALKKARKKFNKKNA